MKRRAGRVVLPPDAALLVLLKATGWNVSRVGELLGIVPHAKIAHALDGRPDVMAELTRARRRQNPFQESTRVQQSELARIEPTRLEEVVGGGGRWNGEEDPNPTACLPRIHRLLEYTLAEPYHEAIEKLEMVTLDNLGATLCDLYSTVQPPEGAQEAFEAECRAGYARWQAWRATQQPPDEDDSDDLDTPQAY